ncbi:MAG: glycosyltransferase family 2 protein [Candidatus Omnitrophota bacterium]
MKLCVIIPTFNESKAIGGIISTICKLGLDVLVVDDGSNDNTAEIAGVGGATVIKNKANKGKGAALAEGFHYALDKGMEAVITMDGDGQHSPKDIPVFLSAIPNSNSGIIIGNRMSKKRNMPLLRVLTNKFMSRLISSIVKQEIPDTQCGFRLIKSDVLRILNLRTCKYDTESEILIKAARSGFKIESVPIDSIYRGEKSKINPFIDSIRFFKLIIRELKINLRLRKH